MQIRTTGDLRGFLGEVLVGIRDGSIEKGQADSIAKVASQINLSLSCEVNAAIQLKKLGEDHPLAGTLVLTQVATGDAGAKLIATPSLKAVDQDGMIWCDQCDMRVTPDQATGCKSKHCKAKA